MKRYGKDFKLTSDIMEVIAKHMNNELREQVYSELPSCEPEEFINRYLELEPNFEYLLDLGFGIKI